ncbi:MAG: GAF domain-containing protein, partial [Planctomycetota bacterium]
FCFSAVLASLGLTYFVSEKYQAATTIFYRPMEVSLLRQKETESFGAPVPFAPFRVISQTLRDAVKNEAVLRPVVEALKLDEEIEVVWDTWYERWYHKSKSFIKARLLNLWELLKYGRLIEEEAKLKAIKRLRKNIDIETTKDSYIHILKVKDKYPQRAAKIVDRAGQVMVDWLRKQQQRQTEERVRQFEQRVASKQAQILDLQEQRKKLLEDNDLVSLSEETIRALSNLYEMRLEDIRIGAQIQKKEKEIAEYEQGIRAKPSGYVQSEDIKNMRSAKLFGEVELKGLKAESSFMASSVKDLEDHLAKLPSLQQRLEMLELQIASATREHEHLKDLYTEASAQVMPAQSETRVLHMAVVPSAPVQPIKVYHVGLTAVLAVLFATGLACVLDFLGTADDSGGKSPDTRRMESPAPSSSGIFERASDILKELARDMNAEGGSIFLQQRKSLVLAHSLDPGHAPATIPLPPRKGSVFEQVMTSGQPVLIEDIARKDGVYSSGWKDYRDNSLLAFPLSGQTGKTVGIVSLHNKARGPFTQQDKERGTELLASQIAAETPRRRLHPTIRYSLIIIGGAILAGLVFYFLLKIGC